MVEDLIDILKEKADAENGKSGSNNMTPDGMMKGVEKYMPKMNNFKFPSMPSGMKLK
jgi:hypothetical protein